MKQATARSEPAVPVGWVRGGVAVLALTGAWLLWSALTIRVEYYDGWDTIRNAWYLAGGVDSFFYNRAPMISILILPAVWLQQGLGVEHNLVVYHLVMAGWHLAGLVMTWWLLRRVSDARAALLALLSAVLVVVFFSYAPFLSHDILPGMFWLAMIVAAERYVRKGDAWLLAVLALCGAAGPLVKQPYGIFWTALVMAWALEAVIAWRQGRAVPWKRLAGLALAAGVSLVLYVAVTGWVQRDNFAEAPWFTRWLLAIQHLFEAHDRAPWWWLYLRNYHWYGFVNLLLIGPALWLALRQGDRLRRVTAVCWLIAFLGMNVLENKEVRYIAFLMPLSALLLTRPLGWLWARARWRWALVAVLVAQGLFSVREALRLRHPFYQQGQPTHFRAAAEEGAELVIMNYLLTFKAPGTPFAGDPYHRLFHWEAHHAWLPNYHHYPPEQQGHDAYTYDADPLQALARGDATTSFIFASRALVNNAGFWEPGTELEGFVMLAGRSTTFADGTPEDRLAAADGLLISAHKTEAGVVLRGEGLVELLRRFLQPALIDAAGRALPLAPIDATHARIVGEPLGAPRQWTLRGYRITVRAEPQAPNEPLRLIYTNAESD